MNSALTKLPLLHKIKTSSERLIVFHLQENRLNFVAHFIYAVLVGSCTAAFPSRCYDDGSDRIVETLSTASSRFAFRLLTKLRTHEQKFFLWSLMKSGGAFVSTKPAHATPPHATPRYVVRSCIVLHSGVQLILIQRFWRPHSVAAI